MVTATSNPSYVPLPTESSMNPPPTNPSRSSQTTRRWTAISLAGLLLLVILGGFDAHRPESRTHELLKSTGLVKPDLGVGKVSKHRELVSVVLVAGANDHGVLEVTRSMLSMTVGPYELIGVFTEPSDQSQRIVSMLVDHHIRAKVDRHGRGLVRYTAINASRPTTESSESTGVHTGISKAKGEYVAILNADDQLAEYGWDRILMTGLKSDSTLLAVSGRAAANVAFKGDRLEFIDTIGEIQRKNHDAAASPTDVEIRNFGVRSPILYDAKKARSLGWIDQGAEAEGLGDVALCLAGAQQGYKCGYYPIGTRTKEEWKHVPGSPVLKGEELSVDMSPKVSRFIETLAGEVHVTTSSVLALPREIEDVPKTLVTAFSGNHQHTVQQWYRTLHHSPHTRFIAYILPSDVAVDPETYAQWHNVEIRVFDFNRWPDWVDVTRHRGQYAWKDLIVEEIIRDYGGLVFWMDSGDEIEGDFTKTWNEVAEMGMFSISVGGPIHLWTHPGTVAYLNMPPGIMDNNNCNGAMWGVNSQHFDAMNKIIRPLFDCAKTRECIAPLGSSRANHRQDQAALSALIHLAGYKCDSHAPIKMGGDAPGDGSKFCDDGTGHWDEC